MNAPPSLHPSDQTLSSYGLGKLDDRSAEAINEHLEQCSDCRKRVAEMPADSFLERVREAKRAGHSPSGGLEPDSSQSQRGTGTLGATPAHTLPPGLAEHPDYKVLRELGRGGMGVAYLAQNELMGRTEVLKVVSGQMIHRPLVLDRFLREIRFAAKLRHPNIVTAYAAFRLGENLVLAMEYVEGLNLAKLVKSKGPLPIANACNFVCQAALGLQHAHEHNMVHRDINPSNLMLSREGKKALVKVLDFGLAKVTSEGRVDSELTGEGQMLGTPDYIAPEQIRDAQAADIRADVYSLGCTLYFLLAGRPPFQGDSLWDLYQAHFSMEAEPLNIIRPDVPAELSALVAKMMAKDPARRFQTPGEIAQALTPFFKKGGTLPFAPSSSPSLADPLGLPTRQAAIPASGPTSETARSQDQTQEPWKRLIGVNEPEHIPPLAASVAGPKPMRNSIRGLWPAVAVAVGLTAILLVAVVTYRISTDHGELIIQTEDPDIEVIVKRRGNQVTIVDTQTRQRVELSSGEYELQLSGDKPGLRLSMEKFTLKRGDQAVVTVSRQGTERTDSARSTEGSVPPPDKISVAAGPPAAAKEANPAGEWTAVFNGRDLAGWTAVDADGFNGSQFWTVRDGVLHGNGGANGRHLHIYTIRDDYADVRVRAEVKLNAGGNSGLFVRASKHLPYPEGYEAEVKLTPGPKIGSLNRIQLGHSWVEHIVPIEPSPVGPDTWSTVDIEAIGSRLRVFVDGKLYADWIDPIGLPLRRRIALQINDPATHVQFRKIEVKKMVPPAIKGVSAESSATQPFETVTNTLDMKLTLIPAGEFKMGSPDSYKQADGDERPQHLVRITRPFYLGKYEVTQGQYRAVMNENPSVFKGSDELPVENVFWLDAIKFCNKLSEREGRKPSYTIAGQEVSIADGDGYRLPTEAEWEYACRAGSVTVFPFGDDAGELGEYAWYNNNSGGKTHPIGRKRANAWGFYDMLGNVWEWCGDWYAEKYDAASPASDPPGPASGSRRAIRGGAWYYDQRASRPADRWCFSAVKDRFSALGFRVALVQSGQKIASRSEAPSGKPSTPAETNLLEADRRAAGSMLSLGATVKIRLRGQEVLIEPGMALPAEAFQLTFVRFGDRPEMTDAGLVALEGLANLVELHLSKATKVTDAGVAHLRNLPRIEGLWLDGTGLTDAGLRHLKDLRTLKELYLGATAVTDAGLANLADLTQLKRLGIGHSRVTGAGLIHLRGMSELESVGAEGTGVSGEGFVHLSGLTRLRILILWETQVSDAGLEHLQNLRQLEILALSGPGVTDVGLARLRTLTKLQILGLGGGRVTNAGLVHLLALTELRQLNLDKTLVTDDGLHHLSGLTQLKDLRLEGTSVTNAGLAHLQRLTQLKELHLKNTNVSAANAEEFKKINPACQVFTEPAGMTDLEKLQGTWVEATCEWKGQDVIFNDQRPRWTRTIEGNRSFIRDENGEAIRDLTFSLKPGRSPKAINVEVTQGPDAGQTNVGIYQFDGESLKICWTIAGQERPTEFTTKRGTGGICFQIWRRSP